MPLSDPQVDDILSLRSCVEGVQVSLKSGDLVAAAGFINTFLSCDEIVLEDRSFVESGTNPAELLRTAQQTLIEKISERFDAAAEAAGSEPFAAPLPLASPPGGSDSPAIAVEAVPKSAPEAEVEKFMALFPLVGERSDGIKRYSRYVAARVGAQADSALKGSLSGDGVGQIDLLAMLAESVVGIPSKVYLPLRSKLPRVQCGPPVTTLP